MVMAVKRLQVLLSGAPDGALIAARTIRSVARLLFCAGDGPAGATFEPLVVTLASTLKRVPSGKQALHQGSSAGAVK